MTYPQIGGTPRVCYEALQRLRFLNSVDILLGLWHYIRMDYCLCGCGAQNGCFAQVYDADPDLTPDPDDDDRDEPFEFEDDSILAQYDDDPNPYDGNYSEE